LVRSSRFSLSVDGTENNFQSLSSAQNDRLGEGNMVGQSVLLDRIEQQKSTHLSLKPASSDEPRFPTEITASENPHCRATDATATWANAESASEAVRNLIAVVLQLRPLGLYYVAFRAAPCSFLRWRGATSGTTTRLLRKATRQARRSRRETVGIFTNRTSTCN
jgi:hypothetical protein